MRERRWPEPGHCSNLPPLGVQVRSGQSVPSVFFLNIRPFSSKIFVVDNGVSRACLHWQMHQRWVVWDIDRGSDVFWIQLFFFGWLLAYKSGILHFSSLRPITLDKTACLYVSIFSLSADYGCEVMKAEVYNSFWEQVLQIDVNKYINELNKLIYTHKHTHTRLIRIHVDKCI